MFFNTEIVCCVNQWNYLIRHFSTHKTVFYQPVFMFDLLLYKYSSTCTVHSSTSVLLYSYNYKYSSTCIFFSDRDSHKTNEQNRVFVILEIGADCSRSNDCTVRRFRRNLHPTVKEYVTLWYWTWLILCSS